MTIKVKINEEESEWTNFTKLTKWSRYNEITYIDCKFNALKELPKLPNSLQVRYCNNNKLKELPKLPNSLQTLYCSFNELKELPKLPNSLHTLYF